MKLIKVTTSILFALFLMSSCSNCDETDLVENQIGEWKGIRIDYRITAESDTISIDTINLILSLNEDFTGMYNQMNIVNWEKKFNKNSETYEIRTDFEDGTLLLSEISIDNPNFQEWENHSIFQNTFERLSIYHFLNRR